MIKSKLIDLKIQYQEARRASVSGVWGPAHNKCKKRFLAQPKAFFYGSVYTGPCLLYPRFSSFFNVPKFSLNVYFSSQFITTLSLLFILSSCSSNCIKSRPIIKVLHEQNKLISKVKRDRRQKDVRLVLEKNIHLKEKEKETTLQKALNSIFKSNKVIIKKLKSSNRRHK